MKIIKFTALAILLCIIFTAFTGCAYFDGLFGKDDAGDATDDNCHEDQEKDNLATEPSESVIFWQAEFCGYANDSIIDEFAENNKLKGIYALNDPERENAPKTLTFIVDDKETFDEIFADAPFEVDFEKEIIYAHKLVMYDARELVLKDISVEDDCVNIYYTGKFSSDIGDRAATCNPYQRWIVVKMRKTNSTNVNFYW